ncbi:MAG TPA: hypothetical protein VMK30_03265, partial [Pleomorphomonadaceae bacterium]|nr:hypothetical protein [Pleomorphomonadaceae bacterium]
GKSSAMFRPLLSYGITEDLQASISLPMPLYMPQGLPGARTMGMMPSSRDVEILVGWRFHRQGTDVGSRFESTAYAGLDYPVDFVRGDIRTSPGLVGAVVTGYASRSLYVWGGALYRRYMSPIGETTDRQGDVALYSLVLGYRPPTFRKELPHPDWRVFLEAVGEYQGNDRAGGKQLPDTGGHQLFVGPTLLGLYGPWGLSGGPLFRVAGKPRGAQPKDRVRMVVNVTYWF